VALLEGERLRAEQDPLDRRQPGLVAGLGDLIRSVPPT